MSGTRLKEFQLLPDGYKPCARILKLEKEILSCKKCPGLNIPRYTMAGLGYGVKTAEIMVVGQSLHGYNDQTPDRQIPFVGPVYHQDSGVLLYDMLRENGYTIRNGNLYVTNVVKCHPPGNRQSYPYEILNCRDFLSQELRLIRPSIIVAVGRDAQSWFGLPPPTQYASIVRPLKNQHYRIPFKVTYISLLHPSAIRRKGTRYIDDYKRQWKGCLEHILKRGEE